MRKNKILEKLLAIILIFTLTSANFMFVTESLATSLVESLFGQDENTGHKNVEFEAYFGAEDEKETSVISDVNNQELAINMHLGVKETGYLKDAKIAIAKVEDGDELNFKLKETEELSLPGVESVDENVITLYQIGSDKEVDISLPIEYKNEIYVNENKFSGDFVVNFTGVYVDDDGDENEVSKDYTLNVSWKDERDVRVESSVSKYIDYEKGVILQTALKVDNYTEENSLPVKESQIVIDVPSYLDVKPSNITVSANSTMGTNGQTPETIEFNENNWYYDSEEGKLVITVENEKQNVVVDEFENEYLKEADKETVEEDRYFNGSAYDEYLITYTYEDVEAQSEEVIVNSNIEAKMTTFSGDLNDDSINVVTNNNNYEYSLQDRTGDIVSLNIETETGEVSKAYMYANYGASGRYETEFKSNTLVNISYKDIINGLNVEDIENIYIDKEGNVISNNDLYYKQISIAKTNFDSILGEEGTIKVLSNGEEVFTINNESEVNEGGFIVVNFEEQYPRLSFEISKPISEGNLIINNVKAMTNATVDKATLANVESINTKVAIRADYNYVENRVEVGTSESNVKLNDTTSKVNLVLDRDSLSTLAENTDVEMRVELNNAVDTSDVFGHSVFEITLPEAIENIEITNASILYGEGLEITSTELVDRTIRVTVDGVQEGINSGILTNGTNIVINANLKTDVFTPAKLDKIALNYMNNEATSYADEGTEECEFSYSAPTGLVAVNSTFNYNNLGTALTSVRQGLKEDIIDIYSEAKVATMEVIVMNNNGNPVTNLAVLGRIPFEGVKDIATGDELGTTLDTKLVGNVISDERNGVEFNVYYSENPEATKDLENEENGWILEPESLENIKSYLIVPENENYEMNDTDILRFTYEYEIPANLTHNEEIYGTFLAYYTNNGEVATTDEEAVPDKVGLTTGAGPELSIETSVSRDKIKEFEEVQINVVATNTGSTRASEVNVELPIPEGAEYVSYECDYENAIVNYEENIVKVLVPELEREEKVEVVVTLKAQEAPRTGTLDFSAKATAKDLGAVIESEKAEVEIAQAEFEITETDRSDIDDEKIYAPGDTEIFTIFARNLKDEAVKNVVVEKVLPEEFTFEKAYIIGYEEDGITSYEEIQGTYDESSRTVSLRIDELEGNRSRQMFIEVKINNLSDDSTKRVVSTTSTVRADGTDTYESNELLTTIAVPVLTVNQTADITDTYIKEGDRITYTFTVVNNGENTAKDVELKDVLPDGLRVQRVSYVANGVPVDKKVSSSTEAVVRTDISPNSELVVNVQTVAASLKGAEEKSITNYATLSATEIEETQTNSITHIVEANEEYRNVLPSGQTNSTVNTANQATQSNIDKTYRVSGIAWLDKNENGTREDGEDLLSGISAKLVNSETGVIQKSVTTDASGAYSFTGIQNGNYLIVFDYDTVKYTVTAYNKDGVAANVNSDVVTTQIEQDGRIRNAAITDVITISNGSISNIDIGLVLADTFDLQLEKSVTKIITQTSQKTESHDYENAKLAKTEIASKYVSGATVHIVYEMKVSNVGDVAGFAKKIVDYMPEGMVFNSALEDNKGWYTGTDGNLYYTGLADTELKSGESRTIKLVLTKQMTVDNTGIINNTAEIFEDYNIYGISDCNSTPGNQVQRENDLGSADATILIKTGEVFIHVSVIITSILLGSIVVFIAYSKIVLVKRKGGV